MNETNNEKLDEDKLIKTPWLWGLFAGALWFLIFSAGILFDSSEYRKALGWQSEKAEKDAMLVEFSRQLAVSQEPTANGNEGSDPTPRAPNGGSSMAGSPRSQMLEDVIKLLSEAEEREECHREKNAGVRKKLSNFALATLLFIPTNVAMLTLLAAFMGGCASNEADSSVVRARLEAAKEKRDIPEQWRLEQQLAYMDESPIYSMMRGLVVYLVFVSGLYVASADPFSDSGQANAQAQYLRLSGLLSLLGFVVGYDPSRFRHWIDLIPSPSHRKSPSEERRPSAPDPDSLPEMASVAAESATEAAESLDEASQRVDDLVDKTKRVAKRAKRESEGAAGEDAGPS